MRRSLSAPSALATSIAELTGAAAFCVRRAEQLDLSHIGGGNGVGVFDVERDNFLRLAVFEHVEVFGLQVAHEVAVLVAHGDVDQDELRLRRKT